MELSLIIKKSHMFYSILTLPTGEYECFKKQLSL